MRDTVARVLATWAFGIATKRYRHRAARAIELGLPLAWGEEKAERPTVSIDWLNKNVRN